MRLHWKTFTMIANWKRERKSCVKVHVKQPPDLIRPCHSHFSARLSGLCFCGYALSIGANLPSKKDETSAVNIMKQLNYMHDVNFKSIADLICCGTWPVMKYEASLGPTEN